MPTMNDCVYIHERIPIEGGARGKMIEMLRSRWAPHVEHEYGVRLVGVWATVGSTGEWPEVRVQWEMDDWEHFARAQAGQYPMEARDVYLAEIWNQALEYRRGGHSMLLRPAAFSPDLAAIAVGDLAGEVVLHEDVRSLPGRMAEYHDALHTELLPLAEARGLRLLGAYEHALLPNTGMNLWALRGWDHWQALMEAEPDDAELQAWTDRQGEWLADIDGFLVVAPPAVALRT
ncbi:MAG: hypothetical protein WDA60_16945 [Acidimicrobiia bacterium]|jgi:hypothetical protein